MDHPSNPHFLDPVSPFPSYVGRREMSPPGIYPTFGPSARKFDMVDGPHGAFHHLDDRPFMRSTFRPSLSGHLPEGGPWNQVFTLVIAGLLFLGCLLLNKWKCWTLRSRFGSSYPCVAMNILVECFLFWPVNLLILGVVPLYGFFGMRQAVRCIYDGLQGFLHR